MPQSPERSTLRRLIEDYQKPGGFGNTLKAGAAGLLGFPSDILQTMASVAQPPAVRAVHGAPQVLGNSEQIAGLLGANLERPSGVLGLLGSPDPSDIGRLAAMSPAFLKVFRGEYAGGKGNFYSLDEDFASQFTQSGRRSEITRANIKQSDIYDASHVYAGDPDAVDVVIAEAKERGKKAVMLNEGTNQPNSIFVFDKTAIKSPKRLED